MRIAIAHDWLVRYAGSERCVEELLVEFPDARLLSTLVDRNALPPTLQRADPSFLQLIPGATRHHEWLLPLMPLAWRLRSAVENVDAVVSSSHACAKAVRVASGIPHLCYCHTPMRYAWDFAHEASRFPAPLRPPAKLAMAWFKHWDRATAARVDVFLANSTTVARRIEHSYGRTARVVHPPVRTDFFTPGEERGDGFLFVGRLTGYKRPDLVVDAFAELPHSLTVVGEGPLGARLRAATPPNVRFLGEVDSHALRHLYRTARALVYPVEEDFGIAMAEAQACGTPVVALRQGGAADIVEDGVTGWLLEEATLGSIRRAVEAAASVDLDPHEIRRRAERFAPERFRAAVREAVEELVDRNRVGG